LKIGNLPDARKHLDACLNLDPVNIEALITMAELHRRRGATPQEVRYYVKAINKAGSQTAAILLAHRFSDMGYHRDAINLYDQVMRSRQSNPEMRVVAGMLAGIGAARFLRLKPGRNVYLQYVVDEFGEFKYFSLQARFLNGTLTEAEFRAKMGNAPEQSMSTEYIVGLYYWLQNDFSKATESFERCLMIESPKKFHNRYDPRKWAREDLARIRGNNAKLENLVDDQP
jgi:tetratricopeptide (TPR) repeat protein